MDLFASDTHLILVDGASSLWMDRLNGKFEAREDFTPSNFTNSEILLGKVHGFLGRLRVSLTGDTRLVFIRQKIVIGVLKEVPIYRISSVITIPLEGDVEISLEPSSTHSSEKNHQDPDSPTAPSSPGNRNVKVKVPPVRGLGLKKGESKVDRRMWEEFHKMFTEAGSFYYSFGLDITNSIQRQQQTIVTTEDEKKMCLWEQADKRFFWNWYMMKPLISSQDKSLYPWILPVVQGFFQTETCTIPRTIDSMGPSDIPEEPAVLDVWIISRRSRYRAGTRYLRRGVDEHGKVANYVESEQIVLYKGHVFSFVEVRGSVPVHWSQAGSIRYRPPPKLERDEDENFKAFLKHFDEELSIYERVVIINLAEKYGREKVLCDAFVTNVLHMNSSSVTYVSFDFHDFCRGMKFENVEILTKRLRKHLRKMGYCWVDPLGMVLRQEGVFRVNCVDCLDRTNVVQTHLAIEMLTYQLSKVGLVAPELGLAGNVKKVLQLLWANNGDTISKQYAGTNALKGDFTRTGERKFTGVMKDGMNSANRYYVNRFRDATRQAAIDLMLGIRKSVTEADLTEEPGNLLDSNIAKKISSASFDRLKYFRRGSGTVVNGVAINSEDPDYSISESPSAISKEQEPRNIFSLNLRLKDIGNEDADTDLIDFNPAMTPDPSHPPTHPLVNDLVLSSCGILSPGRRQVVREVDFFVETAGASPTTQNSEYIAFENSPSPVLLGTANRLQQHRHSLPVNSLAVGATTEPPKRSRTPEITITEESNIPQTPSVDIASTSSLRVAVARRISRSTEDVNKPRFGFGIPPISIPQTGFKFSNIFSKSDSRSGSQQNISDVVNLKESHSDNALRENPFQTQKREAVLAPLGKLAKGVQNLGASYFDPRKLREQFKPIQKQDDIEDPELEEKKRQCATEFIEISHSAFCNNPSLYDEDN